MVSRVIHSRATTTPDINDDASSTLSSHVSYEIRQLVTDAANNKAKLTQARKQDADRDVDSDANLSGQTKADLAEMIKTQKDMLGNTIIAITANRASTAAPELPIRTAARKMIAPAKFKSGA